MAAMATTFAAAAALDEIIGILSNGWRFLETEDGPYKPMEQA